MMAARLSAKPLGGSIVAIVLFSVTMIVPYVHMLIL
jgi:hypothetical protein